MNLLNPLITPALLLTHKALINIFNSSQKNEILRNTFSESFDFNAANNWLAIEVSNNFSNFPSLEIRSAREINDADGAYAADNNTIYLATEFVNQNLDNPDAISNVILEEYGHFLDSRFNNLDTPGDEGALFTNYVQQNPLTKSQLTAIRAENDLATVAIDNRIVTIEQANPGNNPAFDLIGLTKLRNDPQYAGIDGSGFSVAVIDTGIDTEHPFLAPNYVAGYDFIDNDSNPYALTTHGTFVSGIIGATNQDIGVAPDVGLISLRAMKDNGRGSFTEIEKALTWVLENQEKYNITAVNLSVGSGFFTSESELRGDIVADDIRRLEAAGVTVVSAAGNSYFTNSGQSNQANLASPAISSTIAVGAVWQDDATPEYQWPQGNIDYSTGADRIASFSQRLDAPNMIFAPGAMISSTVPGAKFVGEGGGTSYAAPHIAGAVALLQEASLQFSGRLLAPEEVSEILRTTGDIIIDGDDEDDNVSNTYTAYPRVNIYNAVSEVKRRSDLIAAPTKNNPDNISDDSSGESTKPEVETIPEKDLSSGSTVFRLFRTDIGVHFYTASTVERYSITSNLDNYIYEGESFQSATPTADPLTGIKPVYRFLNSDTGSHFYTMSEVERDIISNNLTNYNFEGIAYYGYESDRPGATPLYRFYNSATDTHFYTPSSVEKDSVLANLPNYQLESNDGIAFYVDPLA